MQELSENDFSFKQLFVPLTTLKAINIIIIVGVLVFGNMLFNGFVWDDNTYIIHNALVHSINLSSLFGNNLFNFGNQYRPLPALYFTILFSLFSTLPFFYHFIQLALHITNTALVFILLKQFFPKKLSLVLSLVFLVHPLQVESVSYIASSDNPLFFLFGILALLLSFKNHMGWKRFTLIFVLLLSSLLTKETGAFFVLLVILYRFLFRKTKLKIFIPLTIAVSLIYFFLRSSVLDKSTGQLPFGPMTGVSFTERLINVPAIVFYYLSNIAYPNKLAIEQMWIVKSVTFSNFYLPLIFDCLFLLSLILLGIYVLKSNKKKIGTFLFFSFWLIGGISAYLQIIPIDYIVADRWMYFPIVGLLGLVGIAVETIKIPYSKIHSISWVTVIILLALLSLRTMIRNTNWVNNLTLYSHDSMISDDYEIETNLGSEYLLTQQYNEAIKHFQIAESLFPYEITTVNLGYSYELAGNIPQAKEYYLKSLHESDYSQDPQKRQRVYEELAKISLYKAKPTLASTIFLQKASQKYPNSVIILIALVYSEYSINHQTAALATAEKAYTIDDIPETKYLYTQVKNKRPINLKEL